MLCVSQIFAKICPFCPYYTVGRWNQRVSRLWDVGYYRFSRSGQRKLEEAGGEGGYYKVLQGIAKVLQGIAKVLQGIERYCKVLQRYYKVLQRYCKVLQGIAKVGITGFLQTGPMPISQRWELYLGNTLKSSFTFLEGNKVDNLRLFCC